MSSLPVGPHRIEEMVKFCLETAGRMLESNGAFSPWGAVIDSSGDRKLVTPQPGATASTGEAYRLMERSMAEQFFKGEIVAGALLALATVPPELKPTYPDAIRLVVESSSISRLIFLPYRQTAKPPAAAEAGGTPAVPEVEFGELVGVNVRRTLFVRE